MSAWRARRTASEPSTLSSSVDRGLRAVIGGAVVIALLLLALLGWVSVVSQPRIARYESGLLALQDGHTAMLDQETGLRGFLVTGELAYLQPYTSGRGDLAGADARLLPLAADRRLTRSIVTLQLSQQQWSDGWADDAASGSRSTPGDVNAESAFLRAGKVLFDRYRAAEGDAQTRTRTALQQVRRTQDVVLFTVLAAVLLVAASTVLTSLRRRDGLRRDLVLPVRAVLGGIQEVSQGRLDGEVVTGGPLELAEVVDGFNAMTRALLAAREAAADRDALIEAQTTRLQGILTMVREIGGSLNLRYVLIAIADAAGGLTQVERVVIWLVTDNGLALEPAWDSELGAVGDAQRTDLGVGVVGRAAKYARATHGAPTDDGSGAALAVPLVVGARVIGVLELGLLPGQQLADEQIEVIETLSIHAATAIEAARLHEGAEHASEHDSLTRLANRRRLETDLAAEVERSLRYARPLSFVMLDLDHFKAVNDTHGHARGDDVLQDVAALISGLLRSTDTAYRYGGEELAVIVRESDSASAAVLAERLRSRIESAFSGPGETGVTASIGVAAMPADAATGPALVAAADAAMYAAKAQGRNCVVVAGTGVVATGAVATAV